MTQNRDQQDVCNAFAGLIDNSAATAAANRLYQEHDEGMRFYCDSRERITPEEARIRDAREAARRGQPQSYTEPETFAELTRSEPEFPRSDMSFDEDFDPSLELEPDENYEIDLDDDLDIIASEDDEIVALELLD